MKQKMLFNDCFFLWNLSVDCFWRVFLFIMRYLTSIRDSLMPISFFLIVLYFYPSVFFYRGSGVEVAKSPALVGSRLIMIHARFLRVIQQHPGKEFRKCILNNGATAVLRNEPDSSYL